MWYWHEGIGWWIMYGGIWILLLCGGLIALIVWGVKKLTERSGSRPYISEKHEPLEIVKERYAKGEISKEVFNKYKGDLM
jgi:putative membrane protein